ncbi:PDZ domain-containing protein [Botrimarina hoheduenensis]|uniref:PDZ domain-containing protein n=1 Tax=Botrimarina hoheduenensis TaxID=2528000 RepID=A0A5C5WEC4_9BACT|nr:PDZ domain-containing protein [Botrimarina hoheduenensis]TWT48419.1 hypothetical protein Pla111_01870 [Botrimarina hoheduenensis]
MYRPASVVALALTLALTAASAEAGNKKNFGGISLPGSIQVGNQKINLGQIVGGGPRVSLPTPRIVTPIPHPTPKPCLRPPVHHPAHPPIACPTPVYPTPLPAPTVVQHPVVTPGVQWYFGMSLERVTTQYGIGLRITSLTHGAPAHLAGLENGDILLASNGQPLQGAQTNEHGVALVQASIGNGTPAPTATTTVVGYVPSAAPTALMLVLDSRTGQATYVSVTPQNLWSTPVPQPTPPAPTATF